MMNTEINSIIKLLTQSERKILPLLKENKDIKSIISLSNLNETQVNRSLLWLKDKNLVSIHETLTKIIELDENGKEYLKKGLPERRFLTSLQNNYLTLNEIKNKAYLNEDELRISIGLLKKKNAIDLKEKVSLTENGKRLLNLEFSEEDLLKKLPLNINELKEQENLVLSELKKRKNIIKIEDITSKSIELTKLGEEILRMDLKDNLLENLTVEMLKKKSWKNKEFRHYNINSVTPKIYGGRRHFVDETLNYIRRIWLDMGFKEMNDNLVQTSFWDLDALFVPQDHSAREMQDTFFVGKNKSILKGDIPKELSKNIKETHENGWTTGSKGWGGKWHEDKAKELLLITHDTFLSAKTLHNLKKEDLPYKSFQIMKVFRNEAVDWKHLFEFYQVGGIVVDENANLRNLLGYLKEFFKKMGYTDVKIKPSFFGYTEPSAEIFAFNPLKNQWVEVGGSGIFRPEVTKPLLGFECPVLAWGLGIERIITSYFNIQDLREIYKNDLKFLRERKEFLK